MTILGLLVSLLVGSGRSLGSLLVGRVVHLDLWVALVLLCENPVQFVKNSLALLLEFLLKLFIRHRSLVVLAFVSIILLFLLLLLLLFLFLFVVLLFVLVFLFGIAVLLLAILLGLLLGLFLLVLLLLSLRLCSELSPLFFLPSRDSLFGLFLALHQKALVAELSFVQVFDCPPDSLGLLKITETEGGELGSAWISRSIPLANLSALLQNHFDEFVRDFRRDSAHIDSTWCLPICGRRKGRWSWNCLWGCCSKPTTYDVCTRRFSRRRRLTPVHHHRYLWCGTSNHIRPHHTRHHARHSWPRGHSHRGQRGAH
mmetsp:Transcript_19307/g.41617  ORF Transcript_19307/g.41617 Transcript_19307/m.41617 type:complete len:313 (+) Transcript_19307:1409-2347(+)